MRTHFRASAALIALLLSLLGAGCEIQFAEEEVSLRYDESTDTLEVLLVYCGISASDDSEKNVRKAVETSQRLLSGWRAFSVPFWPGGCDLDDPDLLKDLDAESAQVLGSISLEEVGAFLDGAERLSGYQVLKVPAFTRALDCLNRAISRAVLAAVERGEGTICPDFDARSHELWVERARSGAPWIRLQDGLFVVDLPVTPETALKLQRNLLEELGLDRGRDDWGWLASVLLHLRSFSIEEEEWVLVFGAPGGGPFRFTFRDRDAVYRPALREALAAAGALPSDGLTLEAIHARFND